MVAIKIIFSNNELEVVGLSRVPCIGEKIAFDDHSYEVSKVFHYVSETDDVIAKVNVIGDRISGRHAPKVLPTFKL